MPPSIPPAKPALDPDRLALAYDFLAQAVAQGELPAAVLLVRSTDGPSQVRAFGRVRLQKPARPVQADDLFLVASITKPVTAAGIVWLVERGELLLDDPVCRYVPEFQGQGKDQVTLRHLLTHSSGLPDMLPENEALRRNHAPLSEFVARICQLPLEFPPGSRVQYQSTGFAVLGEIVQRVTGLPLPEFLRQEIFQPLGMADTSLGIQNQDPARVAEIQLEPGLEKADWNWNSAYWRSFAAPWGGMFTTVGDLERFLRMFLEQKRQSPWILSPAARQAMVRDQTGEPFARWGLGWRLFPAQDWAYFGDLLSPGSFGHGGATGTVAWVDPQRGQTCILFTTRPSKQSVGLLGRCSNLVAAAAVA